MAKTERTIDDIVDVCEKKYRLNVTKKNKQRHVNFLKRQLKKHPEYDLNKVTNIKTTSRAFIYFNHLVDKLLLFSYLAGETEITAGYKGHTYKKKIKGMGDLYLLRPAEVGYSSPYLKAIERQTDRQLFRLIGRIRIRYYSYKDRYTVQNWDECIDETGEERRVVTNLGQKITYETIKKCKSPNPLTFMHGGSRPGSGLKKRLTNF